LARRLPALDGSVWAFVLRLVLVVAAGLVVLGYPGLALADDGAVRDTVRRVLSEDAPNNLAAARRKLQDQAAQCQKKTCSAGVKAEVQVALGMVLSQLGQGEAATQAFKSALALDSSAKLPRTGVTAAMRTQWDAAKPPSNSEADEDDAGPEEPTEGVAATVQLIREALKADQEGRLDECIAKDKQALKIDDAPRTRLHLASCQARAGKLVDALKDSQRALEAGLKKGDARVMRIARIRIKELLERIPHVTFDAPSGVADLSVTFDERPVPIDALNKRFSVDPGKHKVVAEGTLNGFTANYEEEYEIKERDFVTIHITLKPPSNDFITSGQIKCMLAAKSQEDVQKCLPQNQKNLVVRLATDLSGYSDTNAVAVYTPAVNASLASPTAGWNVGGNFLVDAVSAASPEIVSSASPPFEEFRYAYGVTGGYKPKLFGAQGTASGSSSPDYVSYTAGLRLTADLNDKLITPTLGYSYSYDRIGRGPNNYLNEFNPLKGFIRTHELEAGITFVLSPTSLLLIGGTATFERGDGSQPYRYIPTFDPEAVAPSVRPGTSVDEVNRSRLPVKLIEQLPTARDRFAIGARYNRRVHNATLRLEQRIYMDTWGMKASSTDSRYMVDLSRRLRVWPHVRVHGQTDTNFYSLAYTATLDPSGQIVVPLYRTGDRELSPLITVTAGGGVRVSLGDPEGEVRYGLTLVGDVMYTRYLKSLYVTNRTAVYGSLGFDVEF
jgi:hypothetical protein